MQQPPALALPLAMSDRVSPSRANAAGATPSDTRTDTVSVQRIAETLRESMTVVAERTVRREIDRSLRPGAPIARLLRDSIQADMCDDIVFERERRGEG